MVKGNNIRKQFLIRIFSVLITIAFISGAIQLYFMNKQIVNQTSEQAEAVANNVFRGIKQTDVSVNTIEHQIDLKLISYSRHIATILQGKEASEITDKELAIIKEDIGLAGITIFQESQNKDDIVGIVSSEKQEIGFSFKKFGYYEVGKSLLNGEVPIVPGATYSDKYSLVLPIVQSASHTDKPEFFKYAYFHVPGTDYIINPYIQANEVYNYTEKVGPNAEIEALVKESEIVQEIGILNPKVFKDPSLENQLYPPLKKIEAGKFDLQSTRDLDLLTQKTINKTSYIEKVNGIKVYKMFLPLDENKVIYLALDYGKMSGPLYSHSIILIVFGLLSLLILVFLTAGFFNQIYENIQKIIAQIKLLESGDLTVKSEIKDGSELEKLSQSTNRMVDQLNKIVRDTQSQATKTQRLSLLLEADASQSVEKMYEVSTEATIKSREQLLETTSLLDEIEEILDSVNDNNKFQSVLTKIELLRQITNEQTAATTDMTITLSDLLKSLHGQSSELSDISNTLLEQMSIFKL